MMLKITFLLISVILGSSSIADRIQPQKDFNSRLAFAPEFSDGEVLDAKMAWQFNCFGKQHEVSYLITHNGIPNRNFSHTIDGVLAKGDFQNFLNRNFKGYGQSALLYVRCGYKDDNTQIKIVISEYGGIKRKGNIFASDPRWLTHYILLENNNVIAYYLRDTQKARENNE